jgi:hypothetical protein
MSQEIDRDWRVASCRITHHERVNTQRQSLIHGECGPFIGSAMSNPISFTIRPPSRPTTPSSSSLASSPNGSREQSTTADEARNAAPNRQAIRISAAPSRPSPLGPGSSRNGRPPHGGRDKYGRMTFAAGDEEDSDEEAQRFRGKGKGRERDEEITGFGEGGAER